MIMRFSIAYLLKIDGRFCVVCLRLEKSERNQTMGGGLNSRCIYLGTAIWRRQCAPLAFDSGVTFTAQVP
jgi:hypothetical protein